MPDSATAAAGHGRRRTVGCSLLARKPALSPREVIPRGVTPCPLIIAAAGFARATHVDPRLYPFRDTGVRRRVSRLFGNVAPLSPRVLPSSSSVVLALRRRRPGVRSLQKPSLSLSRFLLLLLVLVMRDAVNGFRARETRPHTRLWRSCIIHSERISGGRLTAHFASAFFQSATIL